MKPNSSELSYLLYYATTRRSKVQKVGQFLEKKTASDVWRARIGFVNTHKTIEYGLGNPRLTRLQECPGYSSDLGCLDREGTPRLASLRALCTEDLKHNTSLTRHYHG